MKHHYQLLKANKNDKMETTGSEQSGWNCSVHPSVFFLLGTLVLTTCSTGMLCGSIMTDHWEEITWDRLAVEEIVNGSFNLVWLLDGLVAKISTIEGFRSAYLVPMHGGIWTLCITLREEELYALREFSFPRTHQCVNYLADSLDRNDEQKIDWQHRMQNLSISCALVCLIVMGSAALVGAFGVCKHQISAVLVTGVMYLLAASFALFTLTIIHFKRTQERSPKVTVTDQDGNVDGIINMPGRQGIRGIADMHELLIARIFTTSWSLDLGWGGVMLCVMTSVLWILLSKIMRFNPLSSMF